jgi:predicted transcriptional regulator
MLARKRTEKNNATIIADTDNIVEQQWGLGECNNWFIIMFVTKDGEMVFCRKGEFTEQDKKDFYATIDKYR